MRSEPSFQDKFERIFSYCKIGTSRSVCHFEKSTLKRFIADENYSLIPDSRENCIWVDYTYVPSPERIFQEARESLPNPFQVVTPKVAGLRATVPLKQRPDDKSSSILYQSKGIGSKNQAPMSPAKISFKQFSIQSSDLIKESIAQKSYGKSWLLEYRFGIHSIDLAAKPPSAKLPQARQGSKFRSESEDIKTNYTVGRGMPQPYKFDNSKVSIFRSKDSTFDNTDEARTSKANFKITNNSPKFSHVGPRGIPSNQRGPALESLSILNRLSSKQS